MTDSGLVLDGTNAKVRDFAFPVAVDKEVLRLEITMNDLVLMQVVHTLGRIGDELESHLPTQIAPFLVNQIPQATLMHKFHHKKQTLLR